jgi:PEGA domain
MKNIVTACLVACAVLSSSCATMLKGTTDQITIISDPSGAQVTSNDSPVGVTPVSFMVPSRKDLNIQVSKPGYQPQALQNEADFRWGYEVWAFLIYIIPGVVDCADGAAWGHDNLVMTTHLEPIPQAAAPSATPPVAAAPAVIAPVASTAPPAK